MFSLDIESLNKDLLVIDQIKMYINSKIFIFYLFFFRFIIRLYYRNLVGVFIVFDITNRRSFENLAGWFYEFRVYIEF